jgi:hypothetical protein
MPVRLPRDCCAAARADLDEADGERLARVRSCDQEALGASSPQIVDDDVDPVVERRGKARVECRLVLDKRDCQVCAKSRRLPHRLGPTTRRKAFPAPSCLAIRTASWPTAPVAPLTIAAFIPVSFRLVCLGCTYIDL